MSINSSFAEFLELPEDERLEMLLELSGVKLYLWQKLELKLINKWWTYMYKSNPRLRGIDLWESIYKQRF